MAKWLKSMSPETIKKMTDTFNEFSRLRSLCVGKGWVIINKSLTQVQIIENHPEVEAMKKILLQLQPAGIKFLDSEGRELLNKPIAKASRKRKN